MRQICDVDGLMLLFKVIEPAERIKNEKYDWTVFYNIMNVTQDIYKKKEKQTAAHNLDRSYWDATKNKFTTPK